MLTRSAVHRYKQALGEDVGEIPDGLYPGEYLIPVGKDLAALEHDVISAAITDGDKSFVRDFVIDAMMTLIREDLSALGISHDVFTSERSLHENEAIGKVVSELEARDLVYRGRPAPVYEIARFEFGYDLADCFVFMKRPLGCKNIVRYAER